MLQNIRNEGWYKEALGYGLLVWRIDYDDLPSVNLGDNHAFGFMDKGKVTAFPIIVNSNNSVLTMFGSEDLLKVQVKQIDGKVLLEKEFSK